MDLPDRDGYARVRGKRLYYRRVGKSARGTVLVLHGGPGSTHEYLTPLADLAGAGFELIFYDQLGCGRSERPTTYRDYTIEASADDAEELRRRLKLGRVHLYGHSYGGAVALEAAVRHPRAWTSVVVASGFASMRALWRARRLRVSQLSPINRRAWIQYERTGVTTAAFARAAEEFRTRFSERSVNRPYEAWLSSAHLNFRVLDAMGFRALRICDDGFRRGTMAGWDVTPELSRLRVPMLIVVGQYDHITPECAREIHRAVPHSRLVVARGVGHQPFFETRDRYISLLKEFFDKAN
ncbi:MAG: proline iminopeptidase-family hydrolase [Thermoplasmata archaeon]|nr:proline iminopeptidase-family hydrolase [Thermoplasmata archaeon]